MIWARQLVRPQPKLGLGSLLRRRVRHFLLVARHPFCAATPEQHLKLHGPPNSGRSVGRSGVGPEFEKGDGRLRPSLQQRLPGAEGRPEGRSTAPTAPRHVACGGPIPRLRCAIFSFSPLAVG